MFSLAISVICGVTIFVCRRTSFLCELTSSETRYAPPLARYIWRVSSTDSLSRTDRQQTDTDMFRQAGTNVAEVFIYGTSAPT